MDEVENVLSTLPVGMAKVSLGPAKNPKESACSSISHHRVVARTHTAQDFHGPTPYWKIIANGGKCRYLPRYCYVLVYSEYRRFNYSNGTLTITLKLKTYIAILEQDILEVKRTSTAMGQTKRSVFETSARDALVNWMKQE